MRAVDNAPGAFSRELEALKRRGCTLLVVGPDAGMSRCETLLGDDDRDRTRFVVDTHNGPSPDTDSCLVRAGASDVRSATPASTGDAPSSGPTDLETAADELLDRIDRLDPDSLEPGHLRVCLGDLGVLAPDRTADVTAALSPVTERIREESGMGHAHLSDTSSLRARVEPLFAVTVEIRLVPGGRQQRWLLHEAGLDSGWLPV
jgi:hypothetical protein